MAQFPKSESRIAALAHNIVSGLTGNPTVFPSPPVEATDMTALIDAYTSARNDLAAKQAAAENATATKDEVLQALVEGMKKNLRYAEMITGGEDAKLSLMGWGGKSAAVALQAPGQCRTLEAPQQGEGWVLLDWKDPLDGGNPAAYKVQRRERPAGAWSDVATAVESEITLNSQPRGKEFEYRVTAVNKAGEGEASNIVLAVL